jgi:hypothetical protein
MHKSSNDKRKCFLCQKTGHLAKDCWEDNKNADKRPANWKSISDCGGEQGNVAVQGEDKVEFLLCRVCQISFPTSVELLNDPNMWIADTGATVHSMPSDLGFIESRKANLSDAVTMGNGGHVGAQQVTKLPGVMYDLNGWELNAATLDEVVHVPGAQYNLFSISRMIRNHGWMLGGDENAIWIKKDGKKVSMPQLKRE